MKIMAAVIAIAFFMIGIHPFVGAQERTTLPVSILKMRNMRFCELLVVKEGAVDIYQTAINECPGMVWEMLKLDQVKQVFGATAVYKNGPFYWMMDSQTLSLSEKVSVTSFKVRRVGTLDPATLNAAIGTEPYKVFTPNRTITMVYSKNKPIFELIDPEGHIYVLQARQEKFSIESLPTLGAQMKMLPNGWQYRTRTLTEDLVLNLGPDKTNSVVADEFHQYYTRVD